MNNSLTKRPDGKYEEELGELWTAEYSEHPDTGLWQVELFKHDVAEFLGTDFASLEEARLAAKDYYGQV